MKAEDVMTTRVITVTANQTKQQAARLLAQNETGLPLSTFPETCPWTHEQILDDDFWP